MIVPDLVKAVTDGQKKARVENQGDCFMNERLQELYLVATEQFKIVQDQGLPAPYQTRACAEKFALLIVRECANVIADDDLAKDCGTFMMDSYAKGMRYSAEKIKKHFGVE